ncbi:MAG: acyltransferase, partial [Gorillibacterium sp.]|nr:acyltransferase [Gorillibacterium sp.]
VLIRGMAAILVLMEHLSELLFAYSDESFIVKMVFILNLLGRPSVRVFFVLSGLFISRSILKALYDGRWTWNSYLINRLSRLYIVLVPALMLTYVLNRLGSLWWGSPFDSARESVGVFIGNLLFVQDIVVPTFGTNNPLWSLSCEFWYYLLFPLILLTVISGTRKAARIIYLALIIAIFSLIGVKISSYFLVWLMGTLLLFLPIVPMLKKRLVPLTALALFCLSLLLRPLVLTGKIIGLGESSLILIDFLIGLTFVLFIYALLNFYPKTQKVNKEQRSSLAKVSKTLAGFSFTLYLIHKPILDFVYGWAASLGFSGLKPSLFSFAIEIVLVFIMLYVAFLFSLITEAKTNKLRALMMKKVKPYPVQVSVSPSQRT